MRFLFLLVLLFCPVSEGAVSWRFCLRRIAALANPFRSKAPQPAEVHSITIKEWIRTYFVPGRFWIGYDGAKTKAVLAWQDITDRIDNTRVLRDGRCQELRAAVYVTLMTYLQAVVRRMPREDIDVTWADFTEQLARWETYLFTRSNQIR